MIRLSREKKKNIKYGYLFILPWLIGMLLFFAYPICKSLIISFTKITNTTNFDFIFVGLSNYNRLFFVDVDFLPLFVKSAQDVLINLPLINIFALIVAIVLNGRFKGRGLFRSIFFLPVILGSGFIMQQLLSLNVTGTSLQAALSILMPSQVVTSIGSQTANIITDFFGRITIIFWKSGVQIIIFLSALQNISPSLYEAARVDGATEWEKFWKITLPMAMPMMLLNSIYTIIDLCADSNNEVIKKIIWISFKGFKTELEYASAMSWFYFLFIGILIIAVSLILKPSVDRVKDV